MAFPPGFLDELRSRIALATLVGRRVRLTRRGREQVGLCPFHHEKTPSFYVVEDKGFFHCFGCGAHGDAIGFLMRADNLDFIEAVERLAGEAGLAVPRATAEERGRAQRQKTLLEVLAAAAQIYETRLWSTAGGRARDYLAARGLDDETIRRFHLGWAAEDRHALSQALGADGGEPLLVEAGLLRIPEGGGSPYDYFRNRVLFPIGDRAGRVIAFGGRTLGDEQPKYLNSPDTPLFEKGRVLYAWSAARANAARTAAGGSPGAVPGAIVVEGYMDVIALHRAGFATAVAPLGTALTEAQLQQLWRLAPEPVLCFDGDSAGTRAALRALHRALPLLRPGRTLRFASLPAGEDPDSLIRTAGAAAFAEILAGARPLWAALWQGEAAATALDKPEAWAALRTRLEADWQAIADTTVRNEYRRFLLDQFYAARRRSGAGGMRRNPLRAATAAVIDTAPPPPRPAAAVRHKIALGVLLRHPFLIDEASEELVALDFGEREPEFDRLQRAILAVEPQQMGLDAGALRQHLCSIGLVTTVDAALVAYAEHAGFLVRNPDPDSVRRYWADLTGRIRARERADLTSAAEAFGRHPSEENSRRLLAARERETQEDAAADDFGQGGERGTDPR